VSSPEPTTKASLSSSTHPSESDARWTIRAYLVAFAAALIVPILGFAAVLLWQYAEGERMRLEHSALEEARDIAQAVDGDVGDLLASAQILALTPSARLGQFQDYHRLAQDMQRTLGVVSVIRAHDGQQLVSPLAPFGAPLPKMHLPTDEAVLRTKQPQVSDLFTGAVSQTLLVSVTVPVLREDGEVNHLLNLSFSAERLRNIILREQPPPAWTVAIVDRVGTIMARNNRHEEFAGKSATRDLQENTRGAEGTWEGFTADGREVLGAYARSKIAGWRVAVGVQRADLAAPLRRSLWWLAGLGLGLLASSLLLARAFGRQIAIQIFALADRAAALGRGEAVPPVRATVREIGRVGRALVTASDELHTREAARRESEERLRLAIDAGRMAVWEVDLGSETLVGSPELNQLFGFPVDASPTLEEFRARYYPGERERMAAELQRVLERGERYFEIEIRCVLPDGSHRWLLLRGDIHLAQGGAPTKIVGVLLDISERKRAEAANARLAAIVASSPDAIISLSPDRTIQSWNAAAERLFGYTRDEALGALGTLLVPRGSREGPNGVFDEVMRGDVVQTETLRLHKDGSPIAVAVSAAPMTGEDGVVMGVSAIMRDIREQKRAEQRQQLLINELNHRVKNTLATVQSIASQTLRTAQTAEEARTSFEERLLALSRVHNVLTRENWEAADLDEIVAEAIEPYRDHGGERFHIAGPKVRLTPSMALAMAMALQELATNAVKYGALSRATGEIRIDWELDRSSSPARLRFRWQESGGPPVQTPIRRGFGTRLIERSLAQEIGGEVKIEFDPSGVVCTVDAALQPST
jgi:PAS domain S-box-containing protein